MPEGPSRTGKTGIGASAVAEAMAGGPPEMVCQLAELVLGAPGRPSHAFFKLFPKVLQAQFPNFPKVSQRFPRFPITFEKKYFMKTGVIRLRQGYDATGKPEFRRSDAGRAIGRMPTARAERRRPTFTPPCKASGFKGR